MVLKYKLIINFANKIVEIHLKKIVLINLLTKNNNIYIVTIIIKIQRTVYLFQNLVNKFNRI